MGQSFLVEWLWGVGGVGFVGVRFGEGEICVLVNGGVGVGRRWVLFVAVQCCFGCSLLLRYNHDCLMVNWEFLELVYDSSCFDFVFCFDCCWLWV